MPLSTHASLLQRVRDPRDESGWSEFVARYRPIVVAFGRRSGLGAWEAEDVAQVVMLDLLRVLGSFEYDPARGRFRDFLWIVVKNRVRRHSVSREHLGESALQDVADESDPLAESWRAEWARHHLSLALASVRRSFEPQSLEVFGKLMVGHSVRETAALCGSSPAAVEKVKQRVRARLTEILRGLDEEDVLDGLFS